MVFLGDYFALGLVSVLFLFYFEQGRYITRAGKIFSYGLVLTAATVVLDLLTGFCMILSIVPIWLEHLVNSLYFLFNILTTTSIGMFLFCKILEHVYDPHCTINAKRALSIILAVYCVFIIANIFTGWLFYFDDSGAYQRGPLNSIGYFFTVIQMFFVVVCFIRNRKTSTRSMRNALIQTFPVVLVCITIQLAFPQIMLNGIFFAMADLVLFLNFQGQRQGIHHLTKIYDRSRFFRELDTRLERKEPFQILMVSLKHFGSINQKFGHKVGDEVLYQFATSLDTLLPEGIAFHMNGTVFIQVLPYANKQQARDNTALVQKFLRNGISCVNEQFYPEHVLVDYVCTDFSETTAEIYRCLEYATKDAFQKHQHYVRWGDRIEDQMSREQYLTERLQIVDRAHGFDVWYQPIFCLRTECFCSAEALIRLHEPDGSSISPAEFIPLAEQRGLIRPLTWFVVEEVCKLLSDTQVPLKGVSINLPMTHMLEPDFLFDLNGLVDRYGVDHDRIHLEFTERETLVDYLEIKRVMTQITDAGYKFYLDDFGTGYSNFSCILQLPFYGVKLDKSLSDNLTDLQASRSMVSTLTHLLHSMDFLVITEGAETQDQVDAHRGHNVDRIQGYYYSKPLNRVDLLKFYNL